LFFEPRSDFIDGNPFNNRIIFSVLKYFEGGRHSRRHLREVLLRQQTMFSKFRDDSKKMKAKITFSNNGLFGDLSPPREEEVSWCHKYVKYVRKYVPLK
jgi:hypothetical protein